MLIQVTGGKAATLLIWNIMIVYRHFAINNDTNDLKRSLQNFFIASTVYFAGKHGNQLSDCFVCLSTFPSTIFCLLTFPFVARVVCCTYLVTTWPTCPASSQARCGSWNNINIWKYWQIHFIFVIVETRRAGVECGACRLQWQIGRLILRAGGLCSVVAHLMPCCL